MSVSDSASWWQAAISGFAILASGAIAVFVPWNERRIARRRENDARLDVEAVTSNDDGLQLLIAYRPEFHHHTLSVGVRLIDPRDARLYRGVRQAQGSKNGRPVAVKGSLAPSVLSNGVPLIAEDAARPDRYVGIMFVEYPDERRGPFRATVEIDVLAHGNHLIERRRMLISPMNVEFFSNGPPNIVLDMRGKTHKSVK